MSIYPRLIQLKEEKEGEEQQQEASNNMASSSATRSRVSSWQKSCRKAWTIHFLVCFVVMVSGIFYNDGKLIPSRLRNDGCSKMLINVLSPLEEDGVICCEEESTDFSLLCSTSHPPLYKRLTRLPEAWIIPLVPIFLRGLLLVYQTLFDQRPSESWATYFRRFNFYMVVLSFRAFVLFMGLNWVEEQVVGTHPEECWFFEFARRPSCKGMEFDFSDHTVLYFGQILSIPLTEIVYSWLNPLGSYTSTIFMAGGLYLYAVTLLGEFQTAAYYHTPGEIMVGYAISLIIQLPLAYLQCYSTWGGVRANLFGLSRPVARSKD
jgi:hypothetical protein